MAFAPYTNDRLTPEQGRLLGSFRAKDTDALFEWAERPEGDRGDWRPEWKQVIFMSDGSTRLALVLKTIVWVVVDEASDGSPVAEKWAIKQRREYA